MINFDIQPIHLQGKMIPSTFYKYQHLYVLQVRLKMTLIHHSKDYEFYVFYFELNELYHLFFFVFKRVFDMFIHKTFLQKVWSVLFVFCLKKLVFKQIDFYLEHLLFNL